MSDRRSLFRTAFVVVVVMASPARAQVGLPDTAQALARIDSLIGEHERATAALETALARAEALRRARGAAELDTQRVGVVTVVSIPPAAAVARRTAEAALQRFGALATEEGSPLAGTVLLVEYDRDVVPFREMEKQPRHVRLWLPSWRNEDWRRRIIERALGRLLVESLPADVQAWLGRRGVAFEPEQGALAQVYRTLASAPSTAAASCRNRDLDGCARALGLADAGPVWDGWYDADQLLQWARAQTHLDDDENFRGCFVQRLPGACRTYPSRRGPPAPLDEAARQTFLAFALGRTGAAGYERLADATGGTPLERIAAAGGTTPDSLIAGWRNAVIEARPQLTAGLGRSWFTTLFWALILMALAMRSTRWRLG